jgi:GTP-binding protein
LGEERLITGPEAGITRESIEIEWKYKNHNLKLEVIILNPADISFF